MRLRQSGVAIVLAMGVVALAAVAATAIMSTQSVWARHGELSSDHVQAQALIQVGIDWTRALLGDDRRVSAVDTLGEVWATRLPPVPVENGSLGGQIEDQQGRFNLNNLVKGGRINPEQFEHFRRLLSLLELPPALADAVVDWIDADSEARSQGGAEDAYYLGLSPAYRAANRPLIDAAELSLVRGFDAGVRLRLQPYITALPAFAPLNVNTAAPELIAAVVAGLDIDAARVLVESRKRSVFLDRNDFLRQLPASIRPVNEDISVSSDYFLVRMQVTVGSAQASGSALLFRAAPGWPAVVWRKLP